MCILKVHIQNQRPQNYEQHLFLLLNFFMTQNTLNRVELVKVWALLHTAAVKV